MSPVYRGLISFLTELCLMHDYKALDSRLLVHVSVAFYAFVYPICSVADVLGEASQGVADGV